MDGRRTNGVYTGELAMGKEVGKNIFRASVGVKGEYDENFRLAPTLELCKDFKIDNSSIVIELRYDFTCKILNTYLIVKY
jgi:hypothetical protein